VSGVILSVVVLNVVASSAACGVGVGYKVNELKCSRIIFVQNPWAYTIKHLTAVIYVTSKKAGVFVTVSHIYSSLIFVSKVEPT
jgi:hypothetical protein